MAGVLNITEAGKKLRKDLKIYDCVYSNDPTNFYGKCATGVSAITSYAFGRKSRSRMGNGFWCWRNYKADGWGVIYTGMLSNSTSDSNFKASGIGKYMPGDICCMITQAHLNWGKAYQPNYANYFTFSNILNTPAGYGGAENKTKDKAIGVRHNYGHIAIYMDDGTWWSDTIQPAGFNCYRGSYPNVFVVYLRYGAVNVQAEEYDWSKLWGTKEYVSVGKVRKEGMGGYFDGISESERIPPAQVVNDVEKLCMVLEDLDKTTETDEDMENFDIEKVGEGLPEFTPSERPSTTPSDEVLSSGGFLDSLKPDIDISTGMTSLNLIATDALTAGNFSPQGTLQFLGGLPAIGSNCPVCGKRLEYMPPGGVCSLGCATKLLTQKALGTFMPTSVETNKYVKKIKAIMDMLNVVANLISSIPDILDNVASLPEVYRNYVIVKMNWLFAYIQYFMNKLLIWKNKLIIWILEKVKNGVICDAVAGMFTFVNIILQLVQELFTLLDTAYGVAYKVIVDAMPMFKIEPEEMGFFLTPRSFAGTAPGKFFVPVPNNVNMSLSALDFVDIDALKKMIKVSFPKIREVEMFMEPELFDIRILFSDQNYKMIFKILEPLLMLITLGAQLLPEYKKLVPWNPWYMLALLTEVCPTTRNVFGMPMYP